MPVKRVCLIFLGLFLASSLHAQILPPEGFVAEDSAAVGKGNLSNGENTGSETAEGQQANSEKKSDEKPQGSARKPWFLKSEPTPPPAPSDPCALDPCDGETPLCTPLSPGAKSNKGYVCGCNPSSDSCNAGRKCAIRCSGYDNTCTNSPTARDIYWACVPCARGESCKCPVGQIADGAGHCIVDDKCSPNPCDKATPICELNTDVEKGYVCGCDPFSCPQGQECSLPKDGVYVCAPCKAGTECRCEKGFVADGKGGCKPKPSCDKMTCPKGTSCVDSGIRLCCKVNDIDCSAGCANCDRITGTCSACYDGYFLSEGKCVPCGENCSVCSNGNACSACKNGYRLMNGKCIASSSCEGIVCPIGQSCKDGICGVSCFPRNCAAPIHCNPATHDCTGSRCGCPKGVSDLKLCISCD